jgi:hypothetical protein
LWLLVQLQLLSFMPWLQRLCCRRGRLPWVQWLQWLVQRTVQWLQRLVQWLQRLVQRVQWVQRVQRMLLEWRRCGGTAATESPGTSANAGRIARRRRAADAGVAARLGAAQ